jgi:hypothetical protein
MTRLEFLEKAREKHGYKYEYPDLPEKLTWHQDIKVSFNGEVYNQKVVKHILLGRCPEKNTKRRTTEEFILEAKKVWGDKYDYSLVEYRNSATHVKIIYDGVIFDQNPQSHLSGMAPELLMNKDFFIKRAKDRWGDKYDYSLVEYLHCKSKVKILYRGVIFEQTPAQHLSCAPENIKLSKRKTTDEFIEEAKRIHDFKYSYDKSEYLSNQTKLIITCPKHGDFKQRPLSHLQGNGCPSCGESRGEKEISKFLEKYNITFSRQHKFPDCRNIFELPFDFYLPSFRIAIEFDGKQHYEPSEFFGGAEAYERLIKNDKIKNDYCEENFINLIRIKYDQENIIWELLWDNLKLFINNKEINSEKFR